MPRDNQPPPTGAEKQESWPVGKALTAVVGAFAAAALFVATPAEESGRTVEATAQADGSIAVKHVRGPQYLGAYLDIVGVATACDGITRGVKMGQRYTEDQCIRLLEAELVEHARHVLDCTPALRQPGRDYQRVAATLLAYNIGWPRYCTSTVDRRFDAGDVPGACDAFRMWNKAGGRVVRGLVARRDRERAWCLKGLPAAPRAALGPIPAGGSRQDLAGGVRRAAGDFCDVPTRRPPLLGPDGRYPGSVQRSRDNGIA